MAPGAPMRRLGRLIADLPGALLRILIRAYQLVISPWLAGRCRYVPSCSHYALEAIERFGALRGGWLAVKRICRCRPGGGWGYDPVPERKENTEPRLTNEL